MLLIAFLINFIIIICELLTLGHVKGKQNILKYYTYLQNFLGFIVSLIFCISFIVCYLSDKAIPEFVRGLRYMTSCGLLATMFVFIVFLGAGKKIMITNDDFLSGFPAQKANIILHYICPVLSSLSFVLFEREINLIHSFWTGIAAIPSCLYWIIYMILSAAKLWEEPYHFAAQERKHKTNEIISVLLIPLSFIVISFILWNLQ